MIMCPHLLAVVIKTQTSLINIQEETLCGREHLFAMGQTLTQHWVGGSLINTHMLQMTRDYVQPAKEISVGVLHDSE